MLKPSRLIGVCVSIPPWGGASRIDVARSAALGRANPRLDRLGISPFPKCSLNEAFGFAVCPRCVWFGADVLDAQLLADIAEGRRPVATAMVGHDARDGNSKAFVTSHSRFEKQNSAVRRLVRFDLRESNARMVVDAVDEVAPSAAAPVRTARISGDAVANTLETPEFFDVDMNDLTWAFALIAALGLGWL